MVFDHYVTVTGAMLEVDLPPPGFIRSVGTVGTHVT